MPRKHGSGADRVVPVDDYEHSAAKRDEQPANWSWLT